MPTSQNTTTQKPSLKSAFFVWMKVALYSFGGPANQIAVMHRLIVEDQKWINEKRFLHALNYCMLLPGPEAQQLAVYIGWQLHRVRGGIIAGVIFVLPGFLSILLLSILYAEFQSTNLVEIFFYGIKPAVTAIVIQALAGMSRKTLKTRTNVIVALLAFVGIYFLNLPFPLIILAAGAIGFLMAKKPNLAEKSDKTWTDDLPPNTVGKLFKTVSIWLAIWLLPVVAIIVIFGIESIYAKEAVFFSKTAVLTFGGAYAVLTYIAQQAVQHYGWLKSGEMLDGLGMAETTPGPLIQVVQFVGFMAAYRFPNGFHPILAGIIGSVITTWVTFVPSFLWIFAGAPYIENVRKFKSLNAAMDTITSAVIGVILNLSLWFSLNTLFGSVKTLNYSFFRVYTPVWETFDWGSFIIMISTIFLAFYVRAGLFSLLFTGFLMGIFFKLLMG
jgi:chromate transporter